MPAARTSPSPWRGIISASPRAGKPAGFSYLGPVFRYRSGKKSQFLQAGIESFGRQDRPAADAEMLALALQAANAFGIADVEIRTGDVALFNALIDALELYPVWRRRLIKDFNRNVSLTDDIEQLTLKTAPGRNEYEGVLAALAGSDRKAALALVTDLMSIAGTTNVGGRSGRRNRRPLPRTGDAEGGRTAARCDQHHQALSRHRGRTRQRRRRNCARWRPTQNSTSPPRSTSSRARVGFMAKRGIDTGKTRFSTSFGRGLDYYTGFEFELHHKGNGTEPLVAGGRYDGLMTQLGSR